MKQKLHRREALKQIVTAYLGLHFVITPSVINLVDFGEYTVSNSEKKLRSFIETVIPGINTNHPLLTIVFRDSFFGFAKYRPLFLYCLNRQTKKKYGHNNFFDLSYQDRSQVIEAGLNSGPNTSALFSASIFISQLTVFSGFYKAPETCHLIGFTDTMDDDPITYLESEKFMGKELTVNGNPL
jgi:hypothetical protein